MGTSKVEELIEKGYQEPKSLLKSWTPSVSTSKAEAKVMTEQRFPKGWDEQRVRRLLAELDARDEDEWIEAEEGPLSTEAAAP